MNTVTKSYTMKRKDWGGLSNGAAVHRNRPSVMERIGKLRWNDKTFANDGELLTIDLSEQDVATIFNSSNGFGTGGYLNTLDVYEEIVRIYTAFGFQLPKEHLPHDGGIIQFSEPAAA